MGILVKKIFIFVLLLVVALHLTIATTFYDHFYPFAEDYDRSEEESIFKTDEIGCPGIQTMHAVDLKQLMGQWYLPFTSENWMNHSSKPTTHVKRSKKKKYLSLPSCIKVDIHPMPVPDVKTSSTNSRYSPIFYDESVDFLTSFRSYFQFDNNNKRSKNNKNDNNNNNIKVHTKCLKTGMESNLNCKPLPAGQDSNSMHDNSRLVCKNMDGSYAEDFQSEYYIVDTDNLSYALVVSCFRSPINHYNSNHDTDKDDVEDVNQHSWAIFSKIQTKDGLLHKPPKNLNKELIKDLLELVKHIGFTVHDVIEVPFEKCH